jgi:hypothetical protein
MIPQRSLFSYTKPGEHDPRFWILMEDFDETLGIPAVGRGQRRFEACLANPALIERTPSHENFFYVLPWEDDYKKKGGV